MALIVHQSLITGLWFFEYLCDLFQLAWRLLQLSWRSDWKHRCLNSEWCRISLSQYERVTQLRAFNTNIRETFNFQKHTALQWPLSVYLFQISRSVECFSFFLCVDLIIDFFTKIAVCNHETPAPTVRANEKQREREREEFLEFLLKTILMLTVARRWAAYGFHTDDTVQWKPYKLVRTQLKRVLMAKVTGLQQGTIDNIIKRLQFGITLNGHKEKYANAFESVDVQGRSPLRSYRLSLGEFCCC